MKKYLSLFLLGAIGLFINTLGCSAATTPSFSGPATTTDSKAFTVKVHLSGDLSNGIQGNLTYDNTKLTLATPTGTVNGFTVSFNSTNKKIMSDNNSNTATSVDVIELNFTPKSAFAFDSSTEVKLSNIMISDAEGNTTPATDITYTITNKKGTVTPTPTPTPDTTEPAKTEEKVDNPKTGNESYLITLIVLALGAGLALPVIKKYELFKNE